MPPKQIIVMRRDLGMRRGKECQSRLGREPFSRAKVSQLSSRGIRID